MKISEVIAALERIQKERGNLTCAEEAAPGFLASRYGETKVVPQYRVLRSGGVMCGETGVLIRGQ